MSATPPPPDARELGGAIEGVNQLGEASEQFFSRMYRSFTRRKPAAPVPMGTPPAYARLIAEREAEISRLSAVLATIDEGVIMQDTEGRLVLMNEAARTLLGGTKAFWESELGMLFTSARGTDPLDSQIEPLAEPTRVQINNRIIGAQVAAVADEQGQRLGTLIVLRDVTREALSDRLKEQFITAVSHELRTPMTVIKGISEILLEQPDDSRPNRKLMETLSRNVDVLDRMIAELLDISEISADHFIVRADPLDLEELLWSTVMSVGADVRRAGLDVSVMVRDAQTLQIRGDAQRLRWALGHLLQNAHRYTEPGGHILLTASRSDDGHIAIQVVDTGVGISDRDLPHIFERFYRGEARSPAGKLIDPRGLGQGLFIAHKVIEAHGGYLTVRSQAGEGSIFTLVLPTA
ncbi:MAG TPA: ATP-binding protein [Candidatus Limnocylindrales bacterium]|nr:ATP-binding protein [Candidatus Limnocylindrales bacterium]